MPPPSPAPCLLTLVLCTLSIGSAAPAQQRARLGHGAADWIATQEGSTWDYLRSISSEVQQRPAETAIQYSVQGTYRRLDGHRWHLVACSVGGAHCYEHWSTEVAGWVVEHSPCANEQSVAGDSACLLAAPVGAVTEWRWSSPYRRNPLRILGADVAGTATGDETFACTARLQDIDAEVAVPAGTFRTVHIRITRIGDAGHAQEDLWFARGIGVVRAERIAGDRREVTELHRFRAGRDHAELRSSQLQFQAPPDWLWSPKGPVPVRWLDRGAVSVAFGGRIALLGAGATMRAVLVGGNGVQALGPEAWAWSAFCGGLPRQWRRPTDLLHLAAMLHAERLQLTGIHLVPERNEVRLTGFQGSTPRAFRIRLQGDAPAIEDEVAEAPSRAGEPTPAEPILPAAGRLPAGLLPGVRGR